MHGLPNKGSPALDALIQWSEHLPTQAELVLNGSSCRVLGSCTASATSIMVLCNCAACATRPVADLFRNGGRVMSLHEWCLHTSLGGASFERLSVRQPGADYPVPLPAWLRAAALHMGGEALKRKQLSVYWWDCAPEGPVSTVPPPPSQRSQELAKRAAADPCGAWRAATVVGFEPRTGLFTLKYHSDPKKKVSQVFLPLALIHFARMGPQLGTPPRNVAEGCTPLPPVLLSPQEEPLAVGGAGGTGAAGALFPPPAPVPTHPVLLQELQNQQQQMLQAIREQQLQEQLRAQELQVRLRQLPHVNLLMTVQQQDQQLRQLSTHPLPMQPQQPQQQLQLLPQLQQQFLQQQLLKAASGGSKESISGAGKGSAVNEWLLKRMPLAGGVDSGECSPMRPGSRAASPISGGSALFSSASGSGSASPVFAPDSLPAGPLVEALSGGAIDLMMMPMLPSQSHSASTSRPATLSWLASTADVSTIASKSCLHSTTAAAAAAANTTSAGATVSGVATATSAIMFPSLSTSSSMPVPPLAQTCSSAAVWSMDMGDVDGSWGQLCHLVNVTSQPPSAGLQLLHLPEQQKQKQQNKERAHGVAGSAAAAVSTLDADLEAMFQALESSAWSNPLTSNALAASTARADSGPLLHPTLSSKSPQLSPGSAQPQPQPQPQPLQSSGAPCCWWLAAVGDGCSPLSPTAVGSPPKRARLNNSSAVASGSFSGLGAASLLGSSIGNSSSNQSRLASADAGNISRGVGSTSTSNNGDSDEAKGGGMDCDWGALLLDGRLLDPLPPAPMAAGVTVPAGMEL